jgi:hypothetical protein
MTYNKDTDNISSTSRTLREMLFAQGIQKNCIMMILIN